MLELSDITFTLFPDIVVLEEDVDLADGEALAGITSSRRVDTLAGFDVLRSTIGATTLSGVAGDVAGFRVSDVLETGFGFDFILGEVALDGRGRPVGLLLEDDVLVDTGLLADFVEGTAAGTSSTGDVDAAGVVLGGGAAIVTGHGADTVSGTAIASGASGTANVTSGIAGGEVSTGVGRDRVFGTASLEGSEGLASGFNDVDLATGAGNDLVSATTTTSGSDHSTRGFAASDVSTGGGRDRVVATVTAEVSAGPPNSGTIDGIVSTDVDAGSQDDVVEAIVDVTLGANAEPNGIRGTRGGDFELGDGDDVLSGFVTIEADATSDFSNTIAVASDIFGDDGDDLLSASLVAEGGDALSPFAFSGNFFGGGGNDSLEASIDLTGGDIVESRAIDSSNVVLGLGDDVVRATASVSGIEISNVAGIAILGSLDLTFDTGLGDDQIIATTVVDGETVSAAFGILNTDITTGPGNDTVSAEVTVVDPDADVAFTPALANSLTLGPGFQRTIDTGAGDDAVRAVGGGGEFGYGISEYAIVLGDGDDLLFARGSTGLFGAIIEGGAGDDTFDVQNGTGQIDGGDGEDTLILVGNAADFTVTPGVVSGPDTSLVISQIETVVFDDGLLII